MAASPPPWKVIIFCLLLLVVSVSPLFLYLSLSHHMDAAAATAVNVDQTDRIRQLGFLGGFLAVSWEADIGEYIVDVFIGTPAVRFSMILDTGSDLTWVKCSSSRRSSSFRRIRRNDRRCDDEWTTSSSDIDDESSFCRYYYSYEDKELFTTGDLATDTFTLNLTSSESNSDIGSSETISVDNVIFGCGNSNQLIPSSGGYNPFVVASGVLGLGGGSLSFTTQLQPLYGHSFSYCLTRTSNANNSISPSKLAFGRSDGQDPRSLNFTSLVRNNPNLDTTYYYVQIRSILVGGEVLDMPSQTWEISQDGSHGGTIIDSGSTVSVFPHHAHQIIEEAFLRKVTKYQVIITEEEDELSPCYNVSGLGMEKLDMPEFGIVFGDGAVWNFPVENYFMEFEDNNYNKVVCLAIRGVKNPRFSIIGNLQQQNFHMVFDRKEGRLGFAPSRSCADI